jgi:hypothetical protein
MKTLLFVKLIKLSSIGCIMQKITSRCIEYSKFIAHPLLHLYNSQFYNYCHLQYHNYFYCFSHCHPFDTTRFSDCYISTARARLLRDVTASRGRVFTERCIMTGVGVRDITISTTLAISKYNEPTPGSFYLNNF